MAPTPLISFICSGPTPLSLSLSPLSLSPPFLIFLPPPRAGAVRQAVGVRRAAWRSLASRVEGSGEPLPPLERRPVSRAPTPAGTRWTGEPPPAHEQLAAGRRRPRSARATAAAEDAGRRRHGVRRPLAAAERAGRRPPLPRGEPAAGSRGAHRPPPRGAWSAPEQAAAGRCCVDFFSYFSDFLK